MYSCSTDLCDPHCSQYLEQFYHKDSPTSKHLNFSTFLLWLLNMIYHCLEPQCFHERQRESGIPGTKVCLQPPPGIPVDPCLWFPQLGSSRRMRRDAMSGRNRPFDFSALIFLLTGHYPEMKPPALHVEMPIPFPSAMLLASQLIWLQPSHIYLT